MKALWFLLDSIWVVLTGGVEWAVVRSVGPLFYISLGSRQPPKDPENEPKDMDPRLTFKKTNMTMTDVTMTDVFSLVPYLSIQGFRA